MNNIEKAKDQLWSIGIGTKISNDTLYVIIGDVELEIAEFEIDFRANLYNEHFKSLQ